MYFSCPKEDSIVAEIERTRYGESAKDIAQDFAEQLKYNQDADV